MRTPLSFLVGLVGIIGVVPSSFAVPVKGTLQLPEEFYYKTTSDDLAQWQYHWRVVNDVLATMRPIVSPEQRMIIVLEGGNAATPSTTEPPKFVLDNSRFNPPLIAVTPGTKFAIDNREPIFHLLEITKDGKQVSAGKRVGVDRIIHDTLSEPGVYTIRCSEVPHLQGTIFVTRHKLFTVPDAKGNFSFEEVPQGDYTLQIWYEKKWIHRQPVTVRGRKTVTIVLNESLKD